MFLTIHFVSSGLLARKSWGYQCEYSECFHHTYLNGKEVPKQVEFWLTIVERHPRHKICLKMIIHHFLGKLEEKCIILSYIVTDFVNDFERVPQKYSAGKKKPESIFGFSMKKILLDFVIFVFVMKKVYICRTV